MNAMRDLENGMFGRMQYLGRHSSAAAAVKYSSKGRWEDEQGNDRKFLRIGEMPAYNFVLRY